MEVAKAGITVKIIDEFSQIIYVNKSARIEGKIGEVVSLIPLTPIVSGVKLEGLKFEPKNGKLKMSDTLGISNILTKNVAIINIKTGKLLVVKPNLG
jgi:thiamine pyrophosphokinase